MNPTHQSSSVGVGLAFALGLMRDLLDRKDGFDQCLRIFKRKGREGCCSLHSLMNPQWAEATSGDSQPWERSRSSAM